MNKMFDYKSYPILYIDDEKGNLLAFENCFDKDFKIITALSAEEGLELVKENESIALVVTDQKLGHGKMEGTTLCELIQKEYPSIIRIILTAYKEFDIALNSINTGNIYKYICKPYDPDAVRMDLQRAIDLYILIDERKKITIQIINSLIKALEAKDRYTSGHSEAVTKYASWIVKKLMEKNFGEEIDEPTFLQDIQTAGRLHDIGKIGVVESILNKPGKLTDEEYAEIKKHPITGANILTLVEDLQKYIPFVLHHHERWDGKGYPDELKGEDIPLGSRILSVADTYDAMTSCRSYRKGFPPEKAAQELIACKGSQFDPVMVDAFIEVLIDEGIIKKIN
ncbi:MAG: HD domain-containing phosphohydrolase [bacterium]